jgi:hypothetical protein
MPSEPATPMTPMSPSPTARKESEAQSAPILKEVVPTLYFDKSNNQSLLDQTCEERKVLIDGKYYYLMSDDGHSHGHGDQSFRI